MPFDQNDQNVLLFIMSVMSISISFLTAAFAIPYSLFYIVFGIPAIIAVLFVYRKLREARRITNQIVTANAAETADLWEITLDPMESSLPPPSYNAFIENPELYPVLAGVTDSIPDDDLPPYPGLPESTTKV